MGFLGRGRIGKFKTKAQITLDRRLLFRRYELVWNRDKCIGCGICVDMCPKEAILYVPAQFKMGRRVSDRPQIDFDPDKCILCGECVVSCPADQALIMKVDGKEFVPVIDANAFAMVTRRTSL